MSDQSVMPPETTVAIDGPAASGKSTVARLLAARLGLLYVDSGALYRAATWLALRAAVPIGDATGVLRALRAARLEFFVDAGAVRFRVDGQVPDQALRSASVNARVSEVAAVPAVRQQVVAWLRDTRRFGGVVMEGRDIGTVVFPDSPHKFYLDANPEERARRRFAELAEKGRPVEPGAVAQSLAARDRRDSSRDTDPLRVAEGAVRIDSTGLDPAGVVAVMLERIASGRQA